MQNSPLVSIGVPIYNDAPWLANALEHLLAQEYQNLEIILADDGSTDGSREICHEYASRDGRIRYFEHKHNLGALWNHKFVFDVSKGDYFAWASGHDYLHHSFISRLIEALQANTSVVMCCSQSVFINENGEVLRTAKGGLDTRGLSSTDRLESLLRHLVSGGTANIFYGLYRREILAQLNFARKVDGYDIIMLGEMSLLGEMIQLNQILYYRLVKDDESGKERAERHARMVLNAQGYTPGILMPHFVAANEFLRLSDETQLSENEKWHVFNTVMELDVKLSSSSIFDEIREFIFISQGELASLESYPRARHYRAVQVLDELERARVLGFECQGMHELRSVCLTILERQAETMIADQLGVRFRQLEKYKLSYALYFKRASNLFRGSIFDRAWHLLKRLWYR